MKGMTTTGQPRESGGAVRRAPGQTLPRPRQSKRALAALSWPGTGADPYILQRHAELPTGAATQAMGWPYD